MHTLSAIPAKKVISEKTLELNLVGEMLKELRDIGGFPKTAFWIGPHQRQEARWGMDALISGGLSGRHLAIQFKAPKADPPGPNYPYAFSIGGKQHRKLRKLASRWPQGVLYAVPCIRLFETMRDAAPDFLDRTELLEIESVSPAPGTPGEWTETERHKVVVSARGQVMVHSEKFEPRSFSGESFASRIGRVARRKQGLIPTGEFYEWLTEERPYPQGLASLFIPKLGKQPRP